MTAKIKFPTRIITSKNLLAYRLTKKHLDVLKQFDDLQAYMKQTNKSIPAVRLSIACFSKINAEIGFQSAGRRKLSDCLYKGFPLISGVSALPENDIA